MEKLRAAAAVGPGVSHLASRVAALVCGVSLVLAATPAAAQIYEVVGTRAQGMAGAFTAVADDATATWWNPAGIAVTYFSVVIDRTELNEPTVDPAPGPRWRSKTSSYAAAFPALGLSYYRIRVSEIASRTTTAGPAPGRQDSGAVGSDLRSMVAHQFGATIGQSLGNHLIIASTLRVVRAGDVTLTQDGRTLESAAELDVPVETSGDLDLGALALLGPARVGISVKHVREPKFGEGAHELTMKRQARAGFAWVTGQTGSVAILTSAFDADLTRTATPLGDARHVAAGAEVLFPRHHLAFRGGVSANTIGDDNRSTSSGVSIGIMRGVFLDGAATFGSDLTRKGWSVSFRLTI
jgi:hypothetical protein